MSRDERKCAEVASGRQAISSTGQEVKLPVLDRLVQWDFPV